MNESTSQLRRRHAGMLLRHGVNFFDVARAYGIPPRTLLAWEFHESSKWENDAYVGLEPGPDDSYAGEWPSREEELLRYALMKLGIEDIEDKVLKRAYARFLAKR